MEISLLTKNDLTEDKENGLRELIEMFVNHVTIPEFGGPLLLYIVPKEDFPQLVYEFDGSFYDPGPRPTDAIAHHTVENAQLKAMICIDDSLVSNLSLGVWPFMLSSALYEELMHVRLYVERWQNPDRVECDGNEYLAVLRRHCWSMYDEYIVNRVKTNLFATVPLVAVEGGYITGGISSGHDIPALLDEASQKLDDLNRRTPASQYMIDFAPGDFLSILHRNILDPLVRNAAAYDGMPEEHPRAIFTGENEFYREWLQAYWPDLLEVLRSAAAFDRNPERIVDQMVPLVDALVRSLNEDAVFYPNG